MHNSVKFKVPNGKLLIVKADWTDSITAIQILGDFFIYPEEALDSIENLLIGTKPGDEEAKISEKIQGFVDSSSVTLVGLTPDSIAKAVIMVMNS